MGDPRALGSRPCRAGFVSESGRGRARSAAEWKVLEKKPLLGSRTPGKGSQRSPKHGGGRSHRHGVRGTARKGSGWRKLAGKHGPRSGRDGAGRTPGPGAGNVTASPRLAGARRAGGAQVRNTEGECGAGRRPRGAHGGEGKMAVALEGGLGMGGLHVRGEELLSAEVRRAPPALNAERTAGREVASAAGGRAGRPGRADGTRAPPEGGG